MVNSIFLFEVVYDVIYYGGQIERENMYIVIFELYCFKIYELGRIFYENVNKFDL